MTIFFVYLNNYRDGVLGDPGLNRAILTCESRYVADEFFRELEKSQTGGGDRPFTILRRRGPQLWHYGSAAGYLAFHNTLCTSAFADFATKVMVSYAPNFNATVSWSIPKVDDRRDWVNNGTYFIRNRRQPQFYWFCVDGYIQISERRKTKFWIHATDMADDENKVLIRSDKIEILLAEESLPAYIGRQRATNLLSMCGDSAGWRFRDFVNGFGTVFGSEKDEEHVRAVRPGDGDEWELC